MGSELVVEVGSGLGLIVRRVREEGLGFFGVGMTRPNKSPGRGTRFFALLLLLFFDVDAAAASVGRRAMYPNLPIGLLWH